MCAGICNRIFTKRCVTALAEIVKQSDVLKSIVKAVTQEFSCPVYSDEVRERFKKPCFFLAASSRMTTRADNWLEKELETKLTYYAPDNAKNEISYMDVIDRMQLLFAVGIRAGERFLHIDTIEDDRAGEEQDILTVTITINYIERIKKTVSSDTIESVDVEYNTGGRNEDERWQQHVE